MQRKIAAMAAALLLCKLNFKPADCGAELKIRFVYYENEHGIAYNGDKCDPIFFLGQRHCDPFFTVSITIDRRPSHTVQSDRAKDQNTVQFGDKIVNLNNPFIYNVDSFEGELRIDVRVDDYDSVFSHDHISSFSFYRRLSATPFNSPNVPSEIQLVDNGRARAVLVLQVSAQCHEFFYGPHGSQYCKPASDPSNGYYGCNSTGGKVCQPTYDPGSDCKLTYCSRQPCKNAGNCSNLASGFNCACPQLFGGPTCSASLSACELGTPCHNGGTCIRGTNHSGCACPAGFAGSFCQLDVNECALEQPCRGNGSQCDNWPGTYSCRCRSGWHGRNCTEDVDECAELGASACFNGGACANSPGGFACRCPAGFQGARCDLDVDECQSEPAAADVCDAATQLCQNLEGSFICLCRSEFFGPNCTAGASGHRLGDGTEPTPLAVALGVSLSLLAVVAAVAAAVAALTHRCWRPPLSKASAGCSAFSRDSKPSSESSCEDDGKVDNPVYDIGAYDEIDEHAAGDCGGEGHRSSCRSVLPPPLPPPRLPAEAVTSSTLYASMSPALQPAMNTDGDSADYVQIDTFSGSVGSTSFCGSQVYLE